MLSLELRNMSLRWGRGQEARFKELSRDSWGNRIKLTLCFLDCDSRCREFDSELGIDRSGCCRNNSAVATTVSERLTADSWLLEAEVFVRNLTVFIAAGCLFPLSAAAQQQQSTDWAKLPRMHLARQFGVRCRIRLSDAGATR